MMCPGCPRMGDSTAGPAVCCMDKDPPRYTYDPGTASRATGSSPLLNNRRARRAKAARARR